MPDSVPELRPSGRSYLHRLLPVLPLLAAIMATRAASDHLPWQVALAVDGGTALLGVVAVVSYLRTARLWFDGRALHQRGFLGRRKTVDAGEVATVLIAPSYRAVRSRPAPLLAFLDRGGRALLRIQGVLWDPQQVERFADAVHLGRLERIEQPVSAADLRRTHPAALATYDRHPVRFYLLSMLGSAIVIGALVAVLVLTVGNR